MFFKKPSDKVKHQKITYSQCGEDIIIDFIFQMLKINNPTYIDVGAHHPYYLSNTAFFYDRGSKGISIEPDPTLYDYIKKERPNEICLNVGVGEENSGDLDFYIMNVPTLNTFSKEEAERYATYKNKYIEKVVKIPILSINSIIEKHFNNISPNFISIDVEGMDLLVVKSIDFEKYKPEVLSIETVSYTENNSEVKLTDIIEYVESKGYFLYADTYINSIFVNYEKWKVR
jgi:FkbM family methyltransferase